MTLNALKIILVKTTASRFRNFISQAHAQMEDLIDHAENGPVDRSDKMESTALQCMHEFIETGRAQAMREIAHKAKELDSRASVEYLSEHDVREIACELADVLERFNAERDKLNVFLERLQACSKERAELN